MTAPDTDTLAGLLAKYGSPRLAHRDKATLLNVIFTDPGWDGFFYREEKPDSCAAYLRVDLIGEAIKTLAGAQADENAALRAQAAKGEARIERLEAALRWYGEQARLARLIHSEGDAGRNALARDGGEYARAALEDGE